MKLKWLYEHFPEHYCFVDVFGGSGVVLLNKEPSKVEVFNDKNDLIVHVFRVLRDKSMAKELIRQLAATPYSRSEYLSYCKEPLPDEPIERARRILYVACITFGGWDGYIKSRGFRYSSMKNKASVYYNRIRLLKLVHQRLQNVVIECLDWQDILRRYDKPETLFYLDPPYVKDACRDEPKYQYVMTNEDHEELVDMVIALKGKVVVSGYDNPIYRRLDNAGFARYEKDVKVTTSRISNSLPSTEVLWVKC